MCAWLTCLVHAFPPCLQLLMLATLSRNFNAVFLEAVRIMLVLAYFSSVLVHVRSVWVRAVYACVSCRAPTRRVL